MALGMLEEEEKKDVDGYQVVQRFAWELLEFVRSMARHLQVCHSFAECLLASQ